MDLWCKTKKGEIKVIAKYPWKLGDRPFPLQIGALLENHDTVKLYITVDTGLKAGQGHSSIRTKRDELNRGMPRLRGCRS